jgi:hypothetical protein
MRAILELVVGFLTFIGTLAAACYTIVNNDGNAELNVDTQIDSVDVSVHAHKHKELEKNRDAP